MFNFRIFFYLLFLHSISFLSINSANSAVKELSDNVELSNLDLNHEIEIDEEEDNEDDYDDYSNELEGENSIVTDDDSLKKKLSTEEENNLGDDLEDDDTDESDMDYDDE